MSSGHEAAAAVFVDVDADDLVKRAFGLEAELAGAACLDALRPTLDNAGDEGILLAPDARCDPFACDPPQRCDLLCHRAAYPRHGEIDARAERTARKRGGMEEKSNRRARAGMRVHDRIRDRKRGFHSRQRLADDAGEEAGSGGVRLARPHHHAGQPYAYAVAEAAPRVVGEQQLPDRFLRAVGGQRCEMEIVRNGIRKRRAEYRDRRCEDEFRPVAVADGADRLKERAHSVEVDAVAFLEIDLGLARYDACEMEYGVRARRNCARGLAGGGEV